MTRSILNVGIIGVSALLLCFVQQGSAALAILEWNANSETNLAGYKLYVGPESRVYDTVLEVGSVTNHARDYATGHHFLAVTAYNSDGLESDFSEELSLEIVAPPQLRFESNTLTWAGTGSWQVRWTTDISTNQQIVLTNRVSVGMFPAGSIISVRHYELGATNFLSDFASPISFNRPARVRAIRILVLLQKSRGITQAFTDFAEAPFYDDADDEALYRARLQITQTGVRVR